MTTEYNYWKIFPRMPNRVVIGDITIRDGFQHRKNSSLPRQKSSMARK